MLDGCFELRVKQAFDNFAVTPFAAERLAELWQAQLQRRRHYDARIMVTGALDVQPRLTAPRQPHQASPTFSWAAD
jgi:hypothetical protein